MTIFVTGGCKNGKSTFALRQAIRLRTERRCYVATMLPKDAEELLCVDRHRNARVGMGFTTSEQPYEPSKCFAEGGSDGVFLLDSVTALLANRMFNAVGEIQTEAVSEINKELEVFLDTAEHAIVVSDYIYCDGMGFSETTEEFRHALAMLDRRLAACCDVVVEICSGIPKICKGDVAWI